MTAATAPGADAANPKNRKSNGAATEPVVRLWVTRWRDVTEPVPVFAGWVAWSSWYGVLERRTYAAQREGDLWSAAEFGGKREAVNVQRVTMVVLDIDHAQPDAIETARELFAPYLGCIHTTRRHTRDSPRFRIGLPLAEPVTPEQYAELWRWAQRICASTGLELDASTRDPSRAWFHGGGGEHAEFHELKGAPLSYRTLRDAGELDNHDHDHDERNHGERERDANILQEAVERVEMAVPNLERNNVLYQAAKDCARAGIAPNAIEDVLGEAALAAGLTERETSDTIASAIKSAEGEDEWKRGLLIGKKGARRSLANVLHVLATHPDWQNVLAFDEFGGEVVCLRSPPARKQDAGPRPSASWSDDDTTRTVSWIAHMVGIEVPPNWIDRAVATVAARHPFHAVRDYLEGLTWDGVPRLNTMLGTYFGAAQTELNAAYSSKWMISGVARVMRPGCQADAMLILESEQGKKKSTGLAALVPEESWFTDTIIGIGDKDAYQGLRRKWIIELAELDALRGRETSQIKKFISARADDYRPSYGRHVVHFPRQCVFAGSTNESTYLTDRTGNRRFWPVKCGRVDVEAIRRDRDQLWGEALHRYRGGEHWWLEDERLVERARASQKERETPDDWVSIVRDWLNSPPLVVLNAGPLNPRDGITSAQIASGALTMSPDRIAPGVTKRIGHVMSELGWERRLVRAKQRDPTGKAREWRYFPPAQAVTGNDR